MCVRAGFCGDKFLFLYYSEFFTLVKNSDFRQIRYHLKTRCLKFNGFFVCRFKFKNFQVLTCGQKNDSGKF